MKRCGVPNIAENKYILKKRNSGFAVRKLIRGEYCKFVGGKHLTIEQAKLIVGKVGELATMTNDKTEIMNGLKPFAKKHNIALSKPNFAYVRKQRNGVVVRKKIRGKDCTFVCGRHLTLAKAKLIAGKVGQLSKTTNDKTEIMKGLILFTKKHHTALSKSRYAENKYIQKP